MHIVAIGGGDRENALRYALDRSGAEKSSVLVVPTSSSTEAAYHRKVAAITSYFKDNLGLKDLSVLHEYETAPTPTQLTHELGRASIIYTLGGNTPYMMKKMEEYGIGIALKAAIEEGTVYAGTSAGALLPFTEAHSNPATKPAETDWDYAYVKTLGIIHAVATAHANQYDPTPQGKRPDSRLEALLATFPEDMNTCYAIDNGAALVFDSDAHSLQVIKANPEAHVRLITRTSPGTLDLATIEDRAA